MGSGVGSKPIVEEEKIEETIRRIPKDSFTVLDFMEVFKRTYPKDWKKLVERFGLFGSKKRYTVATYLSNRLDVYSQKPHSLLHPFTRYSEGKFKDYRRTTEEEKKRFGSSWIAVFRKKQRSTEQVGEERKILALIDKYVRAFETADADLMQSLFWVDDERFIEVENHIPEPFGRERFLAIIDWIRKYQKPGWKMKFYNSKVNMLSSEVAYSVSLRDQKENGKPKTSRVTLIFLKKGNEWKIIHGHFSYLPS